MEQGNDVELVVGEASKKEARMYRGKRRLGEMKAGEKTSTGWEEEKLDDGQESSYLRSGEGLRKKCGGLESAAKWEVRGNGRAGNWEGQRAGK